MSINFINLATVLAGCIVQPRARVMAERTWRYLFPDHFGRFFLLSKALPNPDCRTLEA
jgi:hypothetical protein